MAGIFDAFTGNAQAAGQQNARSFLQDIRQETAQGLETGYNRGIAELQAGVQPQFDALLGGYNQAQSSLVGGTGNAIGALQTGTGWGASAVNDLLQPQVAALGGLANVYGDERERAAAMSNSALGLTDPSVARAAFRTSPGYEFTLNQGLESIARQQNRAGMLASGNQMRESQTYGQGLADKEWDDWVNRLYQREGLYAPLETNLTGKLGDAYGVAGGRLADLYGQYGRSAANLYTQQGRDLAQLASQLGGAQANIFGTSQQAKVDFLRRLLELQTQANVGLATGQAQTFVGEGDAAAQASANTINGLLGLARLGLGSGGLAGLFGGGGGGISSLAAEGGSGGTQIA